MRKFITCKHPKASVESHERAAPLHSYNEKRYPLRISLYVIRAIDGARTRGLDLGKVARYQLRHYRISGWWESNPRIQLGRLVFYHWTTPAQLVVCASLSHQRRLVYMMKLYLSTLNLNFFYFFNNIYKSSSGKQFVTQIKSSVSLLSSIPNNCYAVYQKELSLLLI